MQPLQQMVDLEMEDGMVWEWKWRDPDVRSRSGSRSSSPSHVWSLEDQSLFGDLYHVSELSGVTEPFLDT
jgi:hypothetical protein